MSEIELKITEIISNQDWTPDPDMVTVTINTDLLRKVESCVSFMNENDVLYMCSRCSLNFNLFEIASNVDSEEGVGKAFFVDDAGTEYIPFRPEYKTEGCDLKFHKDGDIQAIFKLKHSSSEIWFDIGNIKDLKQMFDTLPTANAT